MRSDVCFEVDSLLDLGLVRAFARAAHFFSCHSGCHRSEVPSDWRVALPRVALSCGAKNTAPVLKLGTLRAGLRCRAGPGHAGCQLRALARRRPRGRQHRMMLFRIAPRARTATPSVLSRTYDHTVQHVRTVSSMYLKIPSGTCDVLLCVWGQQATPPSKSIRYDGVGEQRGVFVQYM